MKEYKIITFLRKTYVALYKDGELIKCVTDAISLPTAKRRLKKLENAYKEENRIKEIS